MAFGLIRLCSTDIAVGHPLAWAVYDDSQRLVLSKGQVVETDDEAKSLVARGAYRATIPATAEPASAPTGTRTGPDPRAIERSSFERARLSVGHSLQLDSIATGDRYYVKLIGYVPEGSIFVTTPRQDGHALLMREGQSFTVRAFSGTQAYGFKASIRRVCNVPYPYLHLEYPHTVEGVTVRSAPRVNVKVICTLARSGDATPSAAAMISDLSPVGVRIDASEALAAKEETVRISFRLRYEQDDAYFVLDAIVRSTRTVAGRPGSLPIVVHGLEFINIPLNERLLLKTLVYSLLATGEVHVALDREN